MLRRASMMTLALPVVAVAARADITTGLIAKYEFDGNLQDSSGNGNHGTAVGGFLYTTDRHGDPARAGEFNGVNSYVTVPNSASLSSPTTAVTQAAWVMLYGTSQVGQAYGPLTMKSTSTANAFMYRMIVSPSGISAAFNDWFQGAGTAVTLDLNEWYHVATVFDGSSLFCYVNGARVDSLGLSLSITQDTRDFTIGADIPGILEIFYGKVDDLHLYNRALSDADIAELYGGPVSAARNTPAAPAFAITRVYPNPTSGHTRVDVDLGTASSAELSVYDVLGRRVRTLLLDSTVPGPAGAEWDGRDSLGTRVPSGVYFARLEVDGNTVSSRIVRIR